MTIYDFTECYYPTVQEKEIFAFEKLVASYVDSKDYNTILNILRRAGIESIYDLYNADERQILKGRGVGLKRIEQIMKMKSAINQNVTRGE